MDEMVAMDVLIKRINRALSKQDERLRVLRGEHGLNDMGRYYITDCRTGSVVAQHVDPKVLGLEIGVLKPSETIV